MTSTGPLDIATGASGASDPGLVTVALERLERRLGTAPGRSGEPIVDHARGTCAILAALNVDAPTRVASVLFGAGDAIPVDDVEREFGGEVGSLVDAMRRLLRLKDVTLGRSVANSGGELETLRRMTLAMASDIRVVLIRLGSRLQTLRWHAATKRAPDPAIAQETLDVLAPLANRLGLGQLKWELEDLAFRFLQPDLYRSIARQLEERRTERESFVSAAVERLRRELARQGIGAEVSGRPKHIRSIYNKMRAKGLGFSEVQDLRAFRVLVEDVKDCYSVLGLVHQIWPPVPREFDDYISRPKSNGYQSLHTVVTAEDERPLEVQIRTRDMHRHAEFGIASHWRYKEGGAGGAGALATGRRGAAAPPAAQGRAVGATMDERIDWMRQLLMWQQEVGATLGGRVATASDNEGDRIYLLTPQARVVELPAGSTPIDFAYHVHTTLGHRCRGARVDGQMVPLNTALKSGQTVEIVAARASATAGADGPSRDWLNPQLGFVRSPRARSKVRQWFNALELARDLSVGRERVEKVLQREGRTALSHDELARRLGFPKPEDLFVALSRDEVGPRMLEEAVRGGDGARGGDAARSGPTDTGTGTGAAESASRPAARGRADGSQGPGVLVVGVDFLMTQLARCCRPAPPDSIVGFVTRGHGVSVHRAECRSFAEMARRAPERVLETQWSDWADGADGRRKEGRPAIYPVDVALRARDRQGLLRDVSDVFARDRMNVIAVQTVSRSGFAHMHFTVEVPSIPRLKTTLESVREVEGVVECRRR